MTLERYRILCEEFEAEVLADESSNFLGPLNTRKKCIGILAPLVLQLNAPNSLLHQQPHGSKDRNKDRKRPTSHQHGITP
jgi:hypothetical protein